MVWVINYLFHDVEKLFMTSHDIWTQLLPLVWVMTKLDPALKQSKNCPFGFLS